MNSARILGCIAPRRALVNGFSVRIALAQRETGARRSPCSIRKINPEPLATMFFYILIAAIGIVTISSAVGKPPDLPPDSDYVTVSPEGTLVSEGKRVRYWGLIGGVPTFSDSKPGDSPSEIIKKAAAARGDADAIVQRMEDLGFNLNRMWHAFPSTDYVKGDGSKADIVDYFISRMKEKGMRIWFAGMNQAGEVKPEDVSILNEPVTAEAWTAGVVDAIAASKNGRVDIRNNLARIWDPRLQAIGIERMKAIATHMNQYTGLRYCDDPVFIVWELSNEEWWMSKMVRGNWQRLPDFFRNQLIAKWNDFLKKKYPAEASLATAWKQLLPGESLIKGTILLAPMAGASSSAASINDASQQAQDALKTLSQKYSREDFEPQRGADVIEFFLQLQMEHKAREAAAIKALGRSTQLSPMVYDTGIGYEIQSQFLHQNADAVTHNAYVNGIGRVVDPKVIAEASTPLAKLQKTIDAERQEPNDGPWNNWLLKPPGIAQGVPWLEHNRVQGKPYFAYEIQIQQAAKYRADFPFRVAALAAIQDWDIICWHYFQAPANSGSTERPYDRPMDISTGAHPQGYHYTYDEVQNAMMRMAAYVFRDGLLAPAPNPTQFIFGRKSLFDPASMDYAGSYGMSGMDMLQTVYQYGLRLKIDPTREDDEVIGPVVKVTERHTHNPYTPTPEIMFDWKKGFVMFDAPAVSAFAGLLGNYGQSVRFTNGVTLSDVTIVNPPGSFDPVDEQGKYIAFGLYTLDGKPLETTKNAALSLVSTSFNTGFTVDTVQKKTIAGGLPVLVSRVGAKISSPALDGMTYVFRDWHFQEIGRGRVTGGVLTIPTDQPIFFVELTR